jgi:hypothetical protein
MEKRCNTQLELAGVFIGLGWFNEYFVSFEQQVSNRSDIPTERVESQCL